MGLVHNKAGDYSNAEHMAQLGIAEAKRLEVHKMDGYFMQLEGLNNFFRRNYYSAITYLEKAIPLIEANNDFANVAVANFYIGKAYWDMKLPRKGVMYFEKVDKEFVNSEYIRPDLRENYELLIDYYKRNNDPKLVLQYVDQLLKADSILVSTHDRLYDTIHKNYDTRELVYEKEKIQRMFENERLRKRILIGVSIALAFAVSILVFHWVKNRRMQEKIFRMLMENTEREPKKAGKGVVKELDIADDTVQKILNGLKKWELNKGFLERDVTLAKLALYLDTNTRYTSEVILYHKRKKFIDYMNSLKIGYIVNELKNDRLKRMYTNDALAREAGFTTTQRFVSAFKAHAEISPTLFIAKLMKQPPPDGEQL